MDQKEYLEQKRERLQRQLDRLDVNGTETIGVYVTGRDGVPASRLRKLERELDATIDRAKKYLQTVKKIEELDSKIFAELNRPKFEAEKASEEAAKATLFESIKAGDSVKLWTGNVIVVKRKNPKSITTPSGTRYTPDEIAGIA